MSEFFKDYKQLLLTSKILKKDKTNPFYNSKYVELKDVLDYAKELCTQHNFIFIQYPDIKDGIKVLKTELRHESGECITASAPIVDGNDYQKVSGSITHMRRYNLTSILGLEEEDDDANGAVEKKQTTKTATTPTTTSKIASAKTIEYMLSIGNGIVDWDDIREQNKVDDLDKLTQSQASQIIEKIKAVK